MYYLRIKTDQDFGLKIDGEDLSGIDEIEIKADLLEQFRVAINQAEFVPGRIEQINNFGRKLLEKLTDDLNKGLHKSQCSMGNWEYEYYSFESLDCDLDLREECRK